jgi:hypothetical protein
MNFILSYKIFEKTSLLNIGVPYSIMKSLQRNFEISIDANWSPLKYKKDILSILKKSENSLIISICKNKLFVTFSYNSEYFIETFELIEKDDFGNENWKKVNRIQGTLSEVTNKIERGCKSYKLASGNWKPEYSTVRKIKKEESKFEDTSINFKKYFAENFNRVVKRMYGKKADIVTGIIINHLKNTKMNLSNKQIKEILFLNVERAKEVDELTKKAKEKDPFKLQSEYIKNNSLTIFDEFIITFEDEMSDKYKDYLNIPIMIEKFGLDKVTTSFCYYLYTKRLINL